MRNRKTKYTDEELIEWIKSFATKNEMREADRNIYGMCTRRKLNAHFPKTHNGLKYTDEDLIEWIKTFPTIKAAREDNSNKYLMILRRGLEEHLPRTMKKKRTQEQIAADKEEKQRLKEERKKNRPGRPKKVKCDNTIPRDRKSNLDDTAASRMYVGEQLEDGTIICGRCQENGTASKQNKGICAECYKHYMNYRRKAQDHNKWNVRDEFCHTTIKHHEKTFTIGLKVDERTQRYLELVGYSFLFKEEYNA